MAGAIDGNPATGWAIHPQIGKNHAAVFEIKEDLNFAGGTMLVAHARSPVRRRRTRSASSACRSRRPSDR